MREVREAREAREVREVREVRERWIPVLLHYQIDRCTRRPHGLPRRYFGISI